MDMSVIFLAAIAVLSFGVVARPLETVPVVARQQRMRGNKTR